MNFVLRKKSQIKQDSNISSIPLKVKKITSPKKNIKLNLKTSSTIKIIIATILLMINLTLIFNISKEIEENNKTIPTITPVIQEPISSKTSMLGSWTTSLESEFSFGDNYKFYWYDSYKYKNDNYYEGTYTFKKGLEALEEMGYTEEDVYLTFGPDQQIEEIYSLQLHPLLFIESGKDLSTKRIKEDEVWWFILIVKDKKAIAYNKTLDLRYNLKRTK